MTTPKGHIPHSCTIPACFHQTLLEVCGTSPPRCQSGVALHIVINPGADSAALSPLGIQTVNMPLWTGCLRGWHAGWATYSFLEIVTQQTLKYKFAFHKVLVEIWVHGFIYLCETILWGECTSETESLYHQLLLSNLEFKWWIEKELAEIKQQQKKVHSGVCMDFSSLRYRSCKLR